MMSTEDDLLARLGSLPAGDVNEVARGRIRGRAQVVLEREKRLRRNPLAHRMERLYSGALEPALVAGACVIYLHWALSAAFSLIH